MPEQPTPEGRTTARQQVGFQVRAYAAIAWRWLRLAYAATVESLCPILLLAILVDCTRKPGWVTYDRDASIYASVARFWRDGLIPYRDVWEFKPPMIFVVLRAGFALWGYEAASLYRSFMILTTLGALSLYAGLRRARCMIAAPVAALGLITLVVVNPWTVLIQNTETLVVAFGAAAIGCASAHQRRPRWWWAMATGACLALATLGKQPAALFFAPLGMQLCFAGTAQGWRARGWYVLSRALSAASGFAIVLGVFVLYFASQGAAAAFYNAVLIDGARYSQDFTPMFLNETVGRVLWQRTPVGARVILFTPLKNPLMWPFTGALAVLVPLTLLRPSRWVAIAWMWLLAASLAVLAGPCGEDHYLVMSFPALVLTTGVVCELLVWPGRRARGSVPEATRLLGGVIIAMLLYGFVWNTGYFTRKARGPRADPAEAQARDLAQRIQATAQPGDTLFLEDQPFQIYLYAGVRPASRFIYYNSPHPRVEAERAAALEAKPTFVFATHVNEERRHSQKANGTLRKDDLWADLVADGYEEWITAPIGTLYRYPRHAEGGGKNQPFDRGS